MTCAKRKRLYRVAGPGWMFAFEAAGLEDARERAPRIAMRVFTMPIASNGASWTGGLGNSDVGLAAHQQHVGWFA